MFTDKQKISNYVGSVLSFERLAFTLMAFTILVLCVAMFTFAMRLNTETLITRVIEIFKDLIMMFASAIIAVMQVSKNKAENDKPTAQEPTYELKGEQKQSEKIQ